MAKQSAGEKCESEDECSQGKVLSKLDKDDILEAKPCGANLSESSCFEKNCSSAFSESSMHSDSPHGSFSTDVGKHAAEKGEEIDREGHISFSFVPKREAVKEVESEKEEHSSSCEWGKQESKKEETHNEGHGSSTIYPIIDAIGKKEENDCEVQESSSVEPLKKKAGEEEIQPGSKHDNHMPSLQSSVEKPDTSSSESHDSQTDVQPSISCEPCSQAADDLLSSKDGENTSFTETSKEETEEESEDEDEQEETCHPYVSQFLHHYIKVGKYVPTSVSKARDFRMRRADAVVEAPSLVTPLLIKRPDYLLTEDENCEGSKKQKKVLPLRQNVSSADEFFESEIGKFFIGLGLSRAREVCNQEVLKLKRREIKKARGRNQEMIDEYKGLIEEHRKTLIANSAFKFKSKSCKLCDFKTESSLVLEGHLLTPHLTTRRELQCGFCDYATRDSKVFAFHVEAMHNRQAILEPPQLHHQCPFCPFETNLKIKATSHVNRCEKVFSSSQNQRPTYDFQPPGVTAKPLNFNNIMNYEETLFSLGRIAKDPRKGSGATRQNGASALVAPQGKLPLLSKKRKSAHLQNQSQEQSKSRLTLIQPDISSNQTFQVVGNGAELIPLYNESIRQIIAVAQSPSNLASLRTGAEEAQQGTQPQTCESPKGTSSTAPVIACEICDGFVKDLAQLRLHMHRTHSVKIHRATLSQRPPLSCQKCDRRCFSDQGLERHLLGAHGMVTPNMQYMAKRGRDAGRCPRCGRIYAAKLVSHMKEVHRMTVRMATLSYKCPICEAVFAMYGHFERHVRKVHTNNRNKSSATVNNGQTSKRPLSAEASTPTIVKYNSSKRPCLPTSSPSTSYQANSVKRPFSAPSSSSATSNPSAAKRPLLSPTTGHFSSAMCPSSAGAPTSALTNPSYSVRPSVAASYSSSTSQLDTVKRPFCATDSTATNSSSSFTRLPIVVQTSDNSSASSSAAKWPPSASTSSPGSAGSNFAARPLLPASTTTAVTGSSSSKESTSGVAFIPATAHTKSPMSPFMAQSSPCRVRVCHIETCDSCLSSFSGLKVAITSDVEDEDSSEDEEEEEEENDSGKNEAARPETMVLDRPCKSEPVDVCGSRRVHQCCQVYSSTVASLVSPTMLTK
ncbi:hypothetical protein HPB51_023834 [Rhipicephalus microplus]|uniref:C2H2-type domain-containing protein n=1 Tax=Rhipicephalus microplus TaxID=6941 RepID=A0A9J6F6E3_RHIMP|nr:hypothetical protein HPB51_023834 [Rhipicephalus microplus]